MQLSNAIRQRIINVSKEENKTLKEISKESGISYPAIISFMNGSNRTLKINTLYEICKVLNMELIDFFDNELFDDVIDEPEKENLKK